jgi:hypothetical protein
MKQAPPLGYKDFHLAQYEDKAPNGRSKLIFECWIRDDLYSYCRVMFRVLLFAFLGTLVWSHSWIHCVDYDSAASLSVGQFNNRACRAWARGIPQDALFGEDRGFNYQPANNRACRDPSTPSTPNRFVPGQRIRLVWPAKNHVAASCTNGFIAYGSLRLYAFPVRDLATSDPSWSEWRTDKYLIHDFDAPGNKGFQNCPDFCPSTDRVPCYGDVVLPRNWTQGWMKFMWTWNFNPNEWFTTCFDAQISTTTSSPSPTMASSRNPTVRNPPTLHPTTRNPTARNPPTLRPTTACAREWGQCGGRGWTGPRCCVPGTRCTTQNAYYAQCLK